MTNQEKVKEFQIACEQNVKLEFMTENEDLLRYLLVQEEIKELIDAIIDGERVGQLDALCDILYVNYGTATLYGITIKEGTHVTFNTTSDFIHALCRCDHTNVQDVHTITYSFAKHLQLDDVLQEGFDRVHASNMTKLGKDGKVLRAENGKIMKPETFVPVDLYDLIYGEDTGKTVAQLETLDHFLLHNPHFTQEEREVIMDIVAQMEEEED